jgi:hypothetical protein
MRIGILGSGDVGRALGRGFAARGHEVKLGTRDPQAEKIRNWLEATDGTVSAGTFADAAAFGELLVMATLWDGTENAIRLANPASFAGKVLLDATNPLDFSRGVPPTLAVAGDDSAGERIQRWLPDAKVVKGFNTVTNLHMVDPDFPGGPPDMFICGEDADAKRTVTELAESLGWPVIDLGGIANARYLEAMAMVFIVNAFATGNWNIAFKLLRK